MPGHLDCVGPAAHQWRTSVADLLTDRTNWATNAGAEQRTARHRMGTGLVRLPLMVDTAAGAVR